MRRYHVIFKQNHETVQSVNLYANSPKNAAYLGEEYIMEYFPNLQYDEIEAIGFFKTESED